MFGLEDSRRYYVCQRYVRMNMGINGLSGIVTNEFSHPVLSGDVFIFFGKSRQMVKLPQGPQAQNRRRRMDGGRQHPLAAGVCTAHTEYHT